MIQVAPHGGTTGFQTYATHRFFWAEQDVTPPVPTTFPGAINVEFEVSEDREYGGVVVIAVMVVVVVVRGP